jgi:hypothetical protein
MLQIRMLKDTILWILTTIKIGILDHPIYPNSCNSICRLTPGDTGLDIMKYQKPFKLEIFKGTKPASQVPQNFRLLYY